MIRLVERVEKPSNSRIVSARVSPTTPSLPELGVPIEVISGLIGHSSTAVTRSTYLHLFDTAKLPAASVLDRYFAKTGS